MVDDLWFMVDDCRLGIWECEMGKEKIENDAPQKTWDASK